MSKSTLKYTHDRAKHGASYRAKQEFWNRREIIIIITSGRQADGDSLDTSFYYCFNIAYIIGLLGFPGLGTNTLFGNFINLYIPYHSVVR